MKKLLFTDLDGTLLDYHTYSCEQVRSSVERLKSAGVTIIFCSSKTWQEQEHYLQELKLREPVIVENGGGIFFPENYINMDIDHFNPAKKEGQHVIALGKTYDHVLKALEESAKKYYPELKYYANLSVEDIAKITNLDFESAKKAKKRDFSETLFNADRISEQYIQFEKAMGSLEFQCTPGSKYVTITDKNTDKGKAVEVLKNLFKQKYGTVISFGAGDSMNDLSMLKAVDYPYLVEKPDQTWVNIILNKLTKVRDIGPQGWNIMAGEILLD